MRVFCDYHHSDLYYSLQLLFEKRLGFEMYRPIGLEWYEQKYWAVYPHPATAHQYLGLDHAIRPPQDIHGNYLPKSAVLNDSYTFEDGIYYVMDPSKDKVQRAVTLDKFKDIEFDIVVSSMPAHISPFNRLIQLYQPKAKHIFQVGNAWGRQKGVRNILSSTAPFSVPGDINVVFYHQEFDLDVYKYTSPTVSTQVNSYIHYMKEMDLLQRYKQVLDSWQFKTYGAGMEDNAHGSQQMADIMAASGWTWHVKPGGDGYGHVIHNSYACGRPTIIKTNYYKNQIGDELLEDQVTCIDISRRSVYENTALLNKLSQPEEHVRLCENAYKRFCDVVDFDEEQKEIEQFLERLV